MPQEAVVAPSWPELWGPGAYRTPGPWLSLRLSPPASGPGSKGGSGSSPTCMHLCPEHLCGRRPSLQGLTAGGSSLALGLDGPQRGLADAIPSSGGRALPCWPPLFFLPGLQASQCSHGPSAGFSQSSPFPIMGPERGGGLLLFRGPPAPLTHTRCWLSQASPGHNGPRGVCSQPPPPQGQHWHHRASASRYCPPGLQKDESYSLLLLLLPQQPSHLLC